MAEPTKLGFTGDGAHCGLTDWYDRHEKLLVEALAKGPEYSWTTDWYASKKEIASACITCVDGRLHIKVSVSDDLDTEGRAEDDIPFTTDLEVIRDAINKTWDAAGENQKDNQVYLGFAIYIDRPAQGGGTYPAWIETYLAQFGDGRYYDTPPGDNYHKWGFQGEGKIPQRVRKRFAAWAESWTEHEEASLTVGKFTIKPWEE